MQPGSGTRREIAFAWFWLVVWIAVVQIFASEAFSATETSRIIRPLLRWLFPDADAGWIWRANFAIRKLSHFLVYALLALLALRAFWTSFDRPFAWLAAASLALALVVAVVDESRQMAARSRTGAWSDVALDMSGAASAVLLVGAVRRVGSART